MTEEVGIVYGTTSPTSFKFAVSDTRIRKNDYIQISHKDIGNVLGQITGIERETNISFEKAKRIGTGEKLSTEDKVSAIVSIIGYKDERGVLSVPRTPFEAGGKVLRAEESLLRSVLGLKDEKGAYIGFLKGHKIKVYLDINSIVQKHISILSKTGGGKSYVVGVLLEELLKKSVPVVIIDPHGEYSSLMHPNINESEYKLMEKFDVKARSYAEQIVEYSPDTKTNLHALPLRLDATNLEARDIIELSNLRQTGPCGGIISRAIRKLRERSLEYTLEDIVTEVSEDKNASRIGIIAPLEYLSSLGVFSYPPTKLSEIVKEGQATIINLKGTSPEAQEIVVARIVSRLFEARKLDKIKAHLLVIEEAHNFCPQQGMAHSSRILKTVASEGRKFGLGLCVVTQRPAKIDKNVLSQCNTQIILKVTNPNDLKAIVQSIESITAGLEDEIQRLSIGEAIVTGGSLINPIIVDIRVRETRHGGQPIEIVRK